MSKSTSAGGQGKVSKQGKGRKQGRAAKSALSAAQSGVFGGVAGADGLSPGAPGALTQAGALGALSAVSPVMVGSSPSSSVSFPVPGPLPGPALPPLPPLPGPMVPPVTTLPASELPASQPQNVEPLRLRDWRLWRDTLTAVSPVRGRAVGDLVDWLLQSRRDLGLLGTVALAVELLEVESEDACASVSALLADRWEGPLGQLLQLARAMSSEGP